MIPIRHHFLFNTLNSVSALMYTDVGAANELLVLLGAYLREVLLEEPEPVAALSREVEIAQMYARLEDVRFRDRLQVTWDVAANLLQALVPTLSLQPMLESAVRNGVERAADGGPIVVSARRVDGWVMLTVDDAGIWGEGAAAARAAEPGMRALAARLDARGDMPPVWTRGAGGGVRCCIRVREPANEPSSRDCWGRGG